MMDTLAAVEKISIMSKNFYIQNRQKDILLNIFMGEKHKIILNFVARFGIELNLESKKIVT
jgi:hypothetical protein